MSFETSKPRSENSLRDPLALRPDHCDIDRQVLSNLQREGDFCSLRLEVTGMKRQPVLRVNHETRICTIAPCTLRCERAGYLFFGSQLSVNTRKDHDSLSLCRKVVFDFQSMTTSRYSESTLQWCIQRRSHLPHMKLISTKSQIAGNVES